MGTNSIGTSLRRSTRVKKPPLPPSSDPRHSPRLKLVSASEKESEKCLQIGPISNVDDLLQTGFFHGVTVTCFSETRHRDIPGIIQGGGFLCGCSRCNYNGQVLSVKMFEKHAGANTKFQADHVFFGNRFNLYEISQFLTNIPEEDVCVRILKLRGDLKQKKSFEEPPFSPTKSIAVRRSARKRRETEFQISNALEENYSSKRLRALLRLEDADTNKELNVEESSCAKALLKTGFLKGASVTNDRLEKIKSSEGSRNILNCYRRYHPKMRLMDVQGLLSTEILEGFRMTYMTNNAVMLTAYIHGAGYQCGCSSCKNTKVITAREIVRHARGFSTNPYESIYLDNGMALSRLVKELKGIPLHILGNYFLGKTKCYPSYNSFQIWKGVLELRHIIHLQHKLHERNTSMLVKKDRFVPTSRRVKRIFLSLKGVLVRCTTCNKKHATLGDEADPNLVVFCNQCDRAYHIGCLKDQKSFKIEDVFDGNWFCCTDCSWVHNILKKICALGAKAVPTPFFDLLKKPHTTECKLVNLSWQIIRGGNTEDRKLLSQLLRLLKSVFKPILPGSQEMTRPMVFGKQVVGTGLDFRGVLFIMIKLNKDIVSVAALRVFGKYAAELPLATTCKLWRQQGYFRMLLSLVEELLHLLHVKLLVSPVHDKMQSVWIDKFGFAKASDQKVKLLREQHGVMLFENTTLLEKEIRD